MLSDGRRMFRTQFRQTPLVACQLLRLRLRDRFNLMGMMSLTRDLGLRGFTQPAGGEPLFVRRQRLRLVSRVAARHGALPSRLLQTPLMTLQRQTLRARQFAQLGEVLSPGSLLL